MYEENLRTKMILVINVNAKKHLYYHDGQKVVIMRQVVNGEEREDLVSVKVDCFDCMEIHMFPDY